MYVCMECVYWVHAVCIVNSTSMLLVPMYYFLVTDTVMFTGLRLGILRVPVSKHCILCAVCIASSR